MNDFFPVEDVYAIPDILYPGKTGDTLHGEAAKSLARCIDAIGRVDLRWMEEDSGLSLWELTDGLNGAIFQNPESYDSHHSDMDGWLLRSQYISGSIQEKLETAKEMNRKYAGRFNSNVLALNAALPKRVPFRDIGFTIGSPWIPSEYYALFAKEELMLHPNIDVFYSPILGKWKVKVPAMARRTVHDIYTYGTERMPAANIFEHTLNAMPIKIYDEEVRSDRKSGFVRILNKDEIIAAMERQDAQQQAFQRWIVKDPQRVKRLEEIYYNTYACIAGCRYDGSFLTLPGLNPEFTPYPHQKNAVARIILEQDVLLNHSVGSGKTNIIIMGLHEKKRMGLSQKNLVVVPNNVLEAFERAHRYLYPDDNILVIHPEREFSPANRRKTLEQVRSGDFVAVYMAFSSFEMIRMSRRYKLDQKAEEIRSLRGKIASSSNSWEKHALDSTATRLCNELAKMEKDLPEDKYLAFEELGITTLVVDEAHNYKNISLKTRAEGVVGMHTAGSVKCNELLEKTRYLRRNGGSLLLSTGTPLTNSISDLFVLQLFLQPEQMELLHLSHFDEWICIFAMKQTGFEIDVDSRNYRIMTRFSRFHNLPELINLFANVCDSYSGEEETFGLPACNGYIDTVVPKSQEQNDYTDELVYRTELCRQKLVKPHEDNLLKITHDGRAMALDIRLVEPNRVPNPKETKIYACAVNIFNFLQKYPGTAQLVFCDLGTPKKGFNVYDELKSQLLQMGVADEQIAFIHDAGTDAKRRKLFKAVNDARVRVLIGSTSKLGTGVNVQQNLIAIHHLDLPWRPADLIQREGRLIRQGNCNPEVFRFRYITAGTFDAYSWQLLENKQRFIGQFLQGSLVNRDARDIDDTVLSYAEIKALCVGDPLLKTRIETSNLLERTKIRSRQRDEELLQMKEIMSQVPERLSELSQIRARLEHDMQRFADCRDHLTRADRLAFGEDLLEALADNTGAVKERLFDELHGFPVLLPAGMAPEKPRVILAGANRYTVNMSEAKASGCIQRIEHLLMHLGDRIQGVDQEMLRTKENRAQALAELGKGNPYVQKAAQLRDSLLEIDRELNRRAEHWAA